MSKLILARHGQTTFNAEGRWTGLTDVPLTDQGHEEARQAGQFIANNIDTLNVAHYSMLRRTYSSVVNILGELTCCPNIDIEAHKALNERDYGVYTGQNKQEVRGKVGEDEFMRIRRGWDYPILDGESLKDLHDRVVPFHNTIVTPDLAADKNVLVVSSNNTLRAYVKHLEDIPETEAHTIELGTAEVRIYDFDDQLNITGQLQHTVGGVH